MNINELITEIKNHVRKYGFRLQSFKSNNMYSERLEFESLNVKILYKSGSRELSFNADFNVKEKLVTIHEEFNLFSEYKTLSWFFIFDKFEFKKEIWDVI